MSELSCSKCGQAPKFKCERCLEAYCSSECQVSDWPEHKSRCYKFPNLIPMHIIKSTSNLSLKSDASSRRQYGSKDNVNDTRRSNNSVSTKARNPIECGESCTGAKPKQFLQDEHFALIPKSSTLEASISRGQSMASSAGSEKPANWRMAYPPPSDFFEAMIQFVEEVEGPNRFVWITELKYEAPLRKLLAEINRNVNQKEPYKPELIYPGALVAAPLENILYRAEILECSPEAQRANIRLIDYGNELRIAYSQIFAPIPIMVNLNAYAFRVCVRGDCGPLELESVLTIKVVGEKDPDGFYNIECKEKSIPLELPVALLTKEKSLSVIKCFIDGRNALLRLSSGEEIDAKLDEILNSEQTIQHEFDKVPVVGSFVAARTLKGWKRSCLLGFFEKNHEFLVYTIDEGYIRLSPQIKHIPATLLNQPMRVFAVSTSSPDYMLSETMLSTAKKLSLQLLPASSLTAGKDSKTHLSCALFEDTRKIVDVVIASVFTGNLAELDLKLWHDNLEAGSFVNISHVLTFKEVYIASSETKEYSKIFQAEHSKCTLFGTDEEIKKGDVVFVCDVAGNKYRGQVINCENTTFKIINVDKGTEQMVQRKCLYKPTKLVRSLPVRCSLVKLMYLETIPTPIANNKALAALESCMENAAEFEVTYGNVGSGGVNQAIDLLFRTKERQSLCKKLLPMVFEPRELPPAAAERNVPKQLPTYSTPIADTTPLPPSPPPTPVTVDAPAAMQPSGKVYTLDDLEIIPIECGEKSILYVLNATTLINLESPYVTAADFNNKQFLRKMENYLAKVVEYCNSPKAPKAGYAPKKMEICLSIFADDNQWYRALCIEHDRNETFAVLFLDYGNVSKVNKKDIMPIPPELMFPANANMVYIEGITTKEQALKFAKFTQDNPVVRAKVVQLPDSDAYLAKVHQFDTIIG